MIFDDIPAGQTVFVDANVLLYYFTAIQPIVLVIVTFRSGVEAMTITVEATFEDGVLKPAEPLPLKPHDRVRLTVEALPARTQSAPLNLSKLFADIEAEVGLFDGPVDLAAESDHYLYGAPKTHSSDGR